ncbi:acyl-CoA synthetase (AMP-forming)/AMP-acid ligase II [Nocardia tenerifensis]|uniref:Acyl-CoA synthetase (AMP-forming)/AMP-acid ligase II n=1 Tax=Nocardia tenerifensis TaxID=228006 RepID=A0A318JRQ6_9NOCA|nr:acyl-CoA synthetase (AMP-forming)/AMP-acid ligase II [Nocardia tenerifensis]
MQALDSAPDQVAVEHGARSVARGQLLTMVGTIAGELRESGLGAGRGVALAVDVTPEALAAWLAAYTLGCRVIGVRPGLSERQRRHVLSNGVDAVLDDRAVATLLTGPARPPTVDARPADIARVAYTSGTTGLPKGCAQTYAAMSAHWTWGKRTWSPDTAELAACTDRYLLFGTLASAVVQDYLALCLLGGGTAVIPETLDAPLFPAVIERLRITATIMNVPRLYQMLDAMRATPTDTSTLRAMVVAGSPLTAHRLKEAIDVLGPVVHQAYGQTETGGLTTLTPRDIEAGVLTSVGRPLPGVRVDVRDGEIYVRNDYMMTEYLGDPAETAEVLVDGWVRTRDLGYLEDGYLYLTGRARDVIIVDALPVYAGPIERLLAAHPDVDQAYVVGAPDDRRGEAIHAFLVPREDLRPDPAELSALVRAELGESSVPQTYTMVPDAPVAASGKPDKKALLELYRQ